MCLSPEDKTKLPAFLVSTRSFGFLSQVSTSDVKRVSVAQVKCEGFFFFFCGNVSCAPPSQSLIHPSIHPSWSPSHAQQPEEEEDGHEEEEGVLPVVAIVEVTVALVITCILV